MTQRQPVRLNRRHFVALAVLTTAAGIVAIFKGRFVTNSPATSGARRTPRAAVLKSPIIGLIQRDGRRPAGYAASISNIVIQVPLSQVWPSQTMMNFAPIDALIAQAKADGIKAARLRITTGMQAPSWIGKQVGTYKVTSMTNTLGTYDCPIWWGKAYLDLHKAFDAALAACYDSDPFIHEVSIWAVGNTYSAEPAIRGFAGAANRAAAIAAGFTTTIDLAACYGFVDSMSSHWVTTRLQGWVPMGWQTLVGNRVKSDMNVTASYAKHIISVNPHANIGIDNADQVAYSQDPTYAMRRGLLGLWTHGDQTATWGRLGSSGANLMATLKSAAVDGVSSMELPSGYNAGVTPSQMAVYDAALRANTKG